MPAIEVPGIRDNILYELIKKAEKLK